MNTLKIFLNSILRLNGRFQSTEPFEQNPFDHPDICAMDLRQLADLPMPYLPAVSVVEAKTQPEIVPLARCA